MKGLPISEYHVFLASPGDVEAERKAVRAFFEEYNRTTARHWGVHFQVIDWENYSTIGVGRPQALITAQTLERFRDSLALVVGIMAQRFGSPTGAAESGTQEEFEWAHRACGEQGYPEIKWFFRKIERFTAPSDSESIEKALDQWKRVQAFRKQLKESDPPVWFREYEDIGSFRDILRGDLSLWLMAVERPWRRHEVASRSEILTMVHQPPKVYYSTLYESFRWLDIAGIDTDRTFKIPLTEIYVRLRVIFDEDVINGKDEERRDEGAMGIQTALARYRHLTIAGDPGSGKSTFLKFIALILADSAIQDDPIQGADRLNLELPLPIPIFVSCWDLSDFLHHRKNRATVQALLEFLLERVAEAGWRIEQHELEGILESGECCLLIDGLDEVPTEKGRALVSRLIEDFVQRFRDNRYVVTCRIRAYTGDVILKGDFARCDIQPFNEGDRRLFLENWVALLFNVPREEAIAEDSFSRTEFDALTGAIERSSRIRTLAINPLLLTVIAIVHWNRKRLPQQRVDLYDECVDVLLGQRKEAELGQFGRKTDVLDPSHEEKSTEERAWTRKRFGEIALAILRSESEELTRPSVIAILRPRFRDRVGAPEEAEAKAERFLDQQELRSGLLVSRRSRSYRFVHLTFQEYLSGWNLANQDFATAQEIIEPHLRNQRWFEPLQLLGGELAKRSDEFLERYIAFLLVHLGETITDQAPIVALCANILEDTRGVADISARTRESYEGALRSTLHAFKEKSGVAKKTQLEILEALGTLGPSVKDHLMDATRSGLLDVRRRAIEMLVPHLSDDDLFSMGHILKDRSKEPIKTYLETAFGRDFRRTLRLIQDSLLGEKAGVALGELNYAKEGWNPETLRNAWLPMLTNVEAYPNPAVRAGIGSALGSLRIGGLPADNRKGVGVRRTDDGRLIPDIDWVEIPGGTFIYQDGEKRKLPAFAIARFLVTNAQFQAFVEDEDGYRKCIWWENISKQPGQPLDSQWPISNHPRENVSWYEAVAFCRWLSVRLNAAVSLPTEEQWMRAARGMTGRMYPWGDEYLSGYANIDETNDGVGPHYLARTTAVGIYPQGASVEGVLDMSGNVWEWVDNPRGAYRVIRGGSCYDPAQYCRSAIRDYDAPGNRDGGLGFRLARSVTLGP